MNWSDKLETERISLLNSVNRIIAEDTFAREDVPVFRSSMMDGIAVKSQYWEKDEPDTENWELGKEFIRADTGDDFSDDYDAVIRIENVEIGNEGKGLKILKKESIVKGRNIKGRGSSIKRGTPLVKEGSKLLPGDIATLAMGNIPDILVYKKPIISFLPTGSELIPPGEKLQRGQNIDSNSLLTKGLLEEFGAETRIYSISRDDLTSMENKLKDALKYSDMILINGGSSKGEEDFGIKLVEKLGKLLFHWTLVAPGRPCGMGEIDGKPIIVVPGPTYGFFNVLQWLVRPCIMHMTGNKEDAYFKVEAELIEDFEKGGSIQFLVGAEVYRNAEGKKMVKLLNFKKVGTYNCLMASGFIHTKSDKEGWKKGDILEINLIRPYIPLKE